VFRPHSHDAADSVDAALESSVEGIRALKISLVALGVTAMAQLVVVLYTGSVALLADTNHNGPRPAATPTAMAGPRTWPGCSSLP
jgi:Co/Zn/Cd efflux system component